MSNGWKIFFGIWSIFALLFAYWQINDPDPQWWVPIYLISSVAAGFAFFGKFNVNILVVLTFGYLALSLFFWPAEILIWVSDEIKQKDLSMKTPEMETNREFFGLVICAVVFALQAIIGRRQRRQDIQKRSSF
ncbi:MAG: transmembrane 220 family protein [Cyclobacteriaceae bacterium]